MSSISFRNLCFIILTIIFGSCSIFNKNSKSEELLFQKADSSWEVIGDAEWTFEKDIIRGRANGEAGYLVTKNQYDNFVLKVDFFPDSTVNSGIFIRCSKDEINPIDCHEINIWDLHPNQRFRTGAIVTKVEPYEKIHTLNKWNTYKIICKKDKTQVWLNGILTAEYDDRKVLNGYIAIQAAETGVIKFRNVRIRSIN